MSLTISRRRFAVALGGAAALPFAAWGQQRERMRSVGMLLPAAADDKEFQARVGAFLQELSQLGWAIGRNLRIDMHWAGPDTADSRRHAAELAALAPDVILAHGAGTVGTLLEATRRVSIVFFASDPVAAGFVENLARPGGNATGFMSYEYSVTGKWLELLKQIAPSVTRAAVLQDTRYGRAGHHYAVIQAMAPSLRVEVSPVSGREAGEIERQIAAFARLPNGGLIMTPNNVAILYRHLFIKLAAEHRLPAVYYDRSFVDAGGLISYGPDYIEQYRRAAGYVDRILKGEKPADLPVQAPTKYETVLNMKAARALGLEVPDVVRLRADEVIE